jgi:hypothetical protein
VVKAALAAAVDGDEDRSPRSAASLHDKLEYVTKAYFGCEEARSVRDNLGRWGDRAWAVPVTLEKRDGREKFYGAEPAE